MDPSLVNMLLSISLITYVPLLHTSMEAHLHDLYYDFHSHSCDLYLYIQLWSVPLLAA